MEIDEEVIPGQSRVISHRKCLMINHQERIWIDIQKLCPRAFVNGRYIHLSEDKSLGSEVLFVMENKCFKIDHMISGSKVQYFSGWISPLERASYEYDSMNAMSDVILNILDKNQKAPFKQLLFDVHTLNIITEAKVALEGPNIVVNDNGYALFVEIRLRLSSLEMILKPRKKTGKLLLQAGAILSVVAGKYVEYMKTQGQIVTYEDYYNLSYPQALKFIVLCKGLENERKLQSLGESKDEDDMDTTKGAEVNIKNSSLSRMMMRPPSSTSTRTKHVVMHEDKVVSVDGSKAVDEISDSILRMQIMDKGPIPLQGAIIREVKAQARRQHILDKEMAARQKKAKEDEERLKAKEGPTAEEKEETLVVYDNNEEYGTKRRVHRTVDARDEEESSSEEESIF
jgi:hypothetical protein